LPFNAQPPPSEADVLPKKNYKEFDQEEDKENMERVSYKPFSKIKSTTDTV